MPLKQGKSKETFSHNVKEMVNAGHPVKQALAASYAMKRKYEHMAEGGYVEGGEVLEDEMHDSHMTNMGEMSPGKNKKLKSKHAGHGFSEGGSVHDAEEDEESGEDYASELQTPAAIQDAAHYEPDELGGSSELAKMLERHYAMGGLVQKGEDVTPSEAEIVPTETTESLLNDSDLTEEAKQAIRDKKKRRIFK